WPARCAEKVPVMPGKGCDQAGQRWAELLSGADPRDVFLIEGVNDGSILLAEHFAWLAVAKIQQSKALNPLVFQPGVDLFQQITEIFANIDVVEPVVAVQRVLFARVVLAETLLQRLP